MRAIGNELGDVTLPVHECKALVERVAASQELRRASRLREFLVYVCAETLERGATVIHEQEIGAAVFGRPPSYDTNVDNIVRVNATGLRKRLDLYFAEEGAAEDVVVQIPRGSYIPVFRRRPMYAPAPELAPADAPTPTEETYLVHAPPAHVSTRPSFRLPARFLWPFAAVALSIACGLLMWQVHVMGRQLERWKAEPGLRAFWGEFFDSTMPTQIVLADTSFSLAEDMMQRSVSLNDYLNYNYRRYAESPTLSEDQRRDLLLVLDRNNGSIGDFRVAQQILALNADPARTEVKFAREYIADEAKHKNLILIGSQASNPWVGLFAAKLNFDLQYDNVQHRPFITNHSPQPGEQAVYTTPDRSLANSPSPPTSGYGVIAYLPGLNGKGKTLALEGTDAQATAATGEFITDDDSLAAFESKLPRGPIPPFEILLKTSHLNGTALRVEVVAFRIYTMEKGKPAGIGVH